MSNDQHQREMAMVLESQPPIFKLNVDCFEELFDWLPLKDLHAIGQTCKRMQQVAGYFFRLTYPEAEVQFLIRARSCGIYCNDVKISAFSDFIENISFDFDHLDCFFFAKSHEFKSLKKIWFKGIKFDVEKIACIMKFLSKIEVVVVYRCKFGVDFYGEFLRYCTNMKRLRVEEMGSKSGYNWLLEHYPSLEHFILNPDRSDNDHQINELTIFFKRNPNLQHFATSQYLLWANQHSFSTSNVKLDTLSILFYADASDAFRFMLNKFHEREVFKRLHIYACDEACNEDCHVVHQLISENAVEKLAYISLPMHVTSLPFINLKELYIQDSLHNRDMDLVASSLVNIERIYFLIAYPNEISTIIRRLRNLSHIAIKLVCMEGNVVNLDFLNRERGKLAGARKVTFYVEEKVFLATKEATQNKNYRLIEVKRIDSHWWTPDYYMYFGY